MMLKIVEDKVDQRWAVFRENCLFFGRVQNSL